MIKTERPPFIKTASFNSKRREARSLSKCTIKRLSQVAGDKPSDGTYRCLDEFCQINENSSKHYNEGDDEEEEERQKQATRKKTNFLLATLQQQSQQIANDGSQKRLRYQVALLGLVCVVVSLVYIYNM